jgi:hypothetical protein
MLARRKTMLDRLNRARDGGVERPIGNGNGNSTGAPDWPFVRGNTKTDDALPYGKKGSVRRLLQVAWPEKLGAMRIRCDTYLYGHSELDHSHAARFSPTSLAVREGTVPRQKPL